MSPRTRELYDAYKASKADDCANGYAHLDLLEDQSEGEDWEQDSSGAD